MPAEQDAAASTIADAQELVCRESGLAYPIRDGVPVMLVEEARALD